MHKPDSSAHRYAVMHQGVTRRNNNHPTTTGQGVGWMDDVDDDDEDKFQPSDNVVKSGIDERKILLIILDPDSWILKELAIELNCLDWLD